MANATKDKAGRPVIVVTGIGVITSLGTGKEDNWKKLVAGQSGIRRISRFQTDGLRTTIAGTVDHEYESGMAPSVMTEKIARIVGEEAIAQAGIGSKGHFPGPLFLAMAPIELEWPHRFDLASAADANENVTYADLVRVATEQRFRPYFEMSKYGIVGEHLAEYFGTEGSPISLTTACASGGTAIQLGVETIRRGDCEVALAIGADTSVTPESLVRFSLLSALSAQNNPPEQTSKPFSKNRDGFVLAEGAAALVLESLEHAQARGAKILGVVQGCGEKSDNFHRTRSSPNGRPIIGCMQNAFIDAGISPDDVDYINAHGTSTPENDKMEYTGLAAVFGERAQKVPISSNKSMIGHTLTAAGAVEAVITLLTIQNQRIPPTINHKVPDPAIPLDVVPNVARDAKIKTAISNSFGFGGQNVCLVLAGEPG